MGKGIYTHYRERLVEIGGKSKCLYFKGVVRKNAYDIGRIFEGRDDKISEFIDFVLSGGKQPLTLIHINEKRDIIDNLGLPPRSKNAPDTSDMSPEDAESARKKHDKQILRDANRIFDTEIAKIKELAREVDEIEKETGKHELYVGFPFVFGSINHGATKTLIKAPLLLIPVKVEVIDDEIAEIRINPAEKIQLNRALIYAYAQAKKLNIEDLNLEFDDLTGFKNVKAIVDYLGHHKIKIDCANSKNIYSYSRFRDPEPRGELSVRYGAVLTRLSLSNAIYDDYAQLERRGLKNDAITELLRMGGRRAEKRAEANAQRNRKKQIKRTKANERGNSYIVKMLDYSQSEVVKKVDEMGNMVIYGPPGTGKSQTIVNIITDAIAKNKRVLVVSQKKAALDVVYSRLGPLSEKAMYISDETKEKKSFYDRCFEAHRKDEVDSLVDVAALQAEYNELQGRIDAEERSLDEIYHLLNDKRPFGLSLSEMYNSSYMLAKNTTEYSTYLNLIKEKEIMALDYKALSDALFSIKAKNIQKTYYDYLVSKEKNPLIDNMMPGLDIQTLVEVKGQLEEVQKSKRGFFYIFKYPYARQVLAHYSKLDNPASLKAIVKTQARLDYPKKAFRAKVEAEIEQQFVETVLAIEDFVSEYDFLKRAMTKDGYISVIDNILRGNYAYVKLVHEALDNYISQRDVGRLLETLDKNMIAILNFAYTTSRNYSHYLDIINTVLPIRIYHEVIHYEEVCKNELAKLVDFPNITARIYKLKDAELSVAYKLCSGKNSTEYRTLYENAPNGKDFLYQISKEQKLWSIRRTMDIYGDFILALFPCWLLSPENVSSILPLTKNLFDIVIFDEASQVFIESTIPTIYRGKNIVVAGDAKQLRPSATFMKRYLGADPDMQDNLSVAAALEVDSLLDLAVARYTSANLTYHYRSRHSELIDFSNSAFYNSKLQVAPNISKNKKDRPIERYKVAGVWHDRTNKAEADKIVEILKNIFATRKHNESIGIITFNSDQQTCIADAIDAAAKRDPDFRSEVVKEKYRLDSGEDTSLFIKNLENVQGDERDIIIFSIGYAKNDAGRIYTNFGSLSSEGGENRLNVAITRAKSKIIVVTSIEPEELKVDDSKNAGPKLLKEYLTYVRAVAEGDEDHVKAVLAGLDPSEIKAESMFLPSLDIESEMKERLEKLGYRVDLGLGNRNSRISLAIYDEKSDRYLVGVEIDKDAFNSSESSMERDVYKPKFLEARGWNIIRVWSRDWWLSPGKVIKTITTAAEKAKSRK